MKIKTKLNLKFFFVFVFSIIGFLYLSRPIQAKAQDWNADVIDNVTIDVTDGSAYGDSGVNSFVHGKAKIKGAPADFNSDDYVLVAETGKTVATADIITNGVNTGHNEGWFQNGSQTFGLNDVGVSSYQGKYNSGSKGIIHLTNGKLVRKQWEYDGYSSPTCTRSGYRSKKCVQTGETRTESIPARGHHWVKRFSHLSCTQNLETWEVCTNGCHSSYSDGPKTKNIKTIFKAPVHHFEELVNDKRATCTTDGRSHYRCTNVINGVRCTACSPEFTVPKTGHYINRDEVTKKPTVYTHGERVFYCKYCNAPVTERDIPKRKFNVYVGNKRVKAIYVGDKLVWNGSVGDVGTDGGKDTFDEIFSLIENNWYYKKHHYNNN